MEIDKFFGPLDIAISGLKAQGKQMEVISSNVANARTSDAGKGEPYRRLEATFKSDGDLGGVELGELFVLIALKQLRNNRRDVFADVAVGDDAVVDARGVAVDGGDGRFAVGLREQV